MFPYVPRRTVRHVRRQSEPQARQAYLVEHYRPGLEPEELGRLATRVRESVAELGREGRPVRYLRSTIVPGDESFLLVIEAASEELVREVYTHAGVSFERLSAAVTDEASETRGRGLQPSQRVEENDPCSRKLSGCTGFGRLCRLVRSWK
jgi:hypothetical protein